LVTKLSAVSWLPRSQIAQHPVKEVTFNQHISVTAKGNNISLLKLRYRICQPFWLFMAPANARSWQFMAPEIAISWQFIAPETASFWRFMALFFIFIFYSTVFSQICYS
jgi:hypothetical protein